MPKQKANLPLEELYPHIDSLSTKNQKTLKEYLEKLLVAKATAAAEELDLINGKKP